MEDVLLPLKEECLLVLRKMRFPEIDKSSIEEGTGTLKGNGTVYSVYCVKAVESSNSRDRNREKLDLKTDFNNVQLAAVKSPHADRIERYLLSVTTNETLKEKVKRILGYYSRECEVWATLTARSKDARDNNFLELYGFLESYEFNPLPAFVCKYYPLGDARSFVCDRTKPRLSIKQRLYLISDVAKALSFMHSVCHIVHRDVRGMNILLEERDGRLVGILGDFGAAKSVFHGTEWLMSQSSESGNDRWSPPEYTRKGGYHKDNGSGDIWSLGCTMLELLQEENPWHPLARGKILDKIAAYEYPPKGERVSDHHYEFMKMCWTKEDRRPSASELYSRIVELAEACDS